MPRLRAPLVGPGALPAGGGAPGSLLAYAGPGPYDCEWRPPQVASGAVSSVDGMVGDVDLSDRYLTPDAAADLYLEHDAALGLFAPADNDYLTQAAADVLYEPAGNYLTQAAADALYAPAGNYQPAGNYLTQAAGDARYQLAGNYLTQAAADVLYQPVGNYLTQAAGDGRYQLAGNYLTVAAGDVRYSPIGALTQAAADALYQPVGNYLTPAVAHAAADTTALTTQVTGDTITRFALGADGRMLWGPGNAAADVRLYRSAGSVMGLRPVADTGSGNLLLEGTAPCTLGVRRTGGTLAAPESSGNGSLLGAFNFEGRATAAAWGLGAQVAAVTEEAWGAAAMGTYLRFNTTGIGGTSPTERARITANGALAVASQPTPATTGANERLRVNTPATVSATANVVLTAGGAAHVPLLIQGAGSQTANLLEVQNSSGTALVSVSAAGALSATSFAGGVHARNANTSTTAFASANHTLKLQNTDATTNNWTEVSFLDANSSIVAAIAARNIDQTNHYGRLQFFARDATSGWQNRLSITSSVEAHYGFVATADSTGAVSTALTVRNLAAASNATGSEVQFTGTSNNNIAARIQSMWNGTDVNSGATLRFFTRATDGVATEWVRLTEAGTLSFPNTAGARLGANATQKIGFWGVTPVAQNTGWNLSASYTAAKGFNPENGSILDVSRTLATLIDTLKAYGILGA